MKGILAALLLYATSFVAQAQPRVILEEQGVENAYPRLSKDGKTILYQSNRTGKWQLYILDISSGSSKQITHDEFNDNLPDWSRDNEWISFVSDKDGNEEIYLMKSDGTGLQRLTKDAGRDIHPYFSPDSKYILFSSTRGNGSLDIYRIHITTRKMARITNTQADETCARYALDMKSIVFLGNDALGDDVYVMNMSNGLTDNVTKTPQVRDGWPVFSGDGKRIYYSSMESGVFSIYRINLDSGRKEQLTTAAEGEEDARASVSADGKTLIYNKRKDGLIAIMLLAIK